LRVAGDLMVQSGGRAWDDAGPEGVALRVEFDDESGRGFGVDAVGAKGCLQEYRSASLPGSGFVVVLREFWHRLVTVQVLLRVTRAVC
jgi:hypothetical protein